MNKVFQRKFRKKNRQRIILLVFIVTLIVLGIYLVLLQDENDRSFRLWEPTWRTESRRVVFSKDYDVIYEPQNENYEGEGQKHVDDKEGYFTTFTTASGKTYKEYKQNGIAPWADKKYWGETMEKSGCGITAVSIILSGYGKDVTPEDLRRKYYPNMDYTYLQNEFKKEYAIDASMFYFIPEKMSKESIISHLRTGKPVLVCVWNKPDVNRWTDNSHYLVLLAADSGQKVYVSNPNGLIGNPNSSGWYDIGTITPYIAKVMYINS